MPMIQVELPDRLHEFVNRKVGEGKLRDASAYLHLLVVEAMENDELNLSEEEKMSIDRLLLQAMDSFDRGEYAPVRPNEFEELAQRLAQNEHGKQPS